MGKPIDKLTIKGFKSIRCLEDFRLGNLNIMIGANGAGKSNFVGLFDFVQAILRDIEEKEDFDSYVTKQGGGDRFLYMGPKITQSIKIRVYLPDNGMHGFDVEGTVDGGLHYILSTSGVGGWNSGGLRRDPVNESRDEAQRNWITYHFHDTSATAGVKRYCSKRDNEYLRPDGSNLAAFLYKLKKKSEVEFRRIRETIQLAAPFFDVFLLRESIDAPDEMLLEWRQKNSDYPFHPSQLSDGTLRFMCLTAALLQPEPPSTILLDEPELGMHPYALTLLAELIKKASHRTQVIVSTQSANLIDYFEPGDIIVVERDKGESVFKRLNADKLKDWLEDYSLGELWQKNVIGGRPGHE